MSRSLGPKQLGVLSAALRHVRDAEHLLAVADPDRSPAQAWYLAGYGPECVRKAGLDDDWLNKTIGHGVVGASETVVAFALAHDPRPRRYGLDRLPAPHSALDPASQPLVEVIGAGALSEGYFEKLARLDYTASGVLPASNGDSPVGAALKALLHKLIRRTPRPDYILFDARAGLHDVAGLSLHGLAHVDVLVARASDQAYQGLDLAIASLARRRKPRDLRLLVAHTFVPPVPGSPEAVAVEREFADRAYDIFQRHVHPTMNPAHIPAPEGDGAHKPALVRALEVLARPSRLLDLQSTLLGDAFADAFDRFDVLCKPEPESEVP